MGFGFYVERDILSGPSSNGHPSGRMTEMMNSGSLDLRPGVKKGHVKDETSIGHAVGYEEPKQVSIYLSVNKESPNFNTGQEVGNHVAGRRTLEDKLQYKSHTSNEDKCQCCPYTCTLGTLHRGNKVKFGFYVERDISPGPSSNGHPSGPITKIINSEALELQIGVQNGHEKEDYKEIGHGEGHEEHKHVVDTHPSGFSEHKESPNPTKGQEKTSINSTKGQEKTSINSTKGQENGKLSKLKRKRYPPEEYKCGDCLYTCTVEAAMKKHALEGDHITLKFSCTICGEDHLDAASVSNHVKTQHRQERHYTCNFKTCKLDKCDFKTYYRTEAVLHRRIHTGEKPHRCPSPECPYRAYHRGNMLRHVARMHKSRNPQVDTFDANSWMANYSRRIALPAED